MKRKILFQMLLVLILSGGEMIGFQDTTGQAQSGAIFVDSGQELVSLQGNNSQAVALGDVDGDGDIDAVVAQGLNEQPQPNLIWLNEGDGQFSLSPHTLGNGDSKHIALGDLDGDTDLDVVIANGGLGINDDQVWINQGGAQEGEMGAFNQTQVLANGHSDRVALGDLDKDGDLDALILGANQIWWNNGSGQLAAGPTLSSAANFDVALGDLDNDQDLDIVLTSFSQFTAGQVFWNDWPTTNSFQPGPSLTLAGDNARVALADLDGDGNLDIHTTSRGANQIWWNNGDQTFGNPVSLGNDDDTHLALGDLDRDGDIDVFVTRSQTATSTVGAPNGLWLNQGDRILSAGTEAIGNAYSLAVALADLDGDQDLDAFVANGEGNKVWLNQSGGSGGTPQTGQFVDSGQALGAHWSTDVALGDLDGDNDLDAFVTSYDNNPDQAGDNPGMVWLNQGGLQGGMPGHFSDSGQIPGGANSQSVDLGDVDGDGDLDALISRDTGVEVWLNQGSLQSGTLGLFDPAQTLTTAKALDVALGDVDNDGDLDAYVMDLGPDDFIFLNQGGLQGGTLGLFNDSGQRLQSPPPPYSAASVTLTDIDADGDLDALVLRKDLFIRFNDGGHQGGTLGTFNQQRTVYMYIDAVSLINLNGDVYPDLVITNYDGTASFRNRGSVNGEYGRFDYHQRISSFASSALAVADFDGDNDDDLLTTGPMQAMVYLNQGGGTLAGEQILGNMQGQALAMGDVDGDGDPDALMANKGANRVWLNGEAETGLWPTLSLPYTLAFNGTAYRYDWWGEGNAVAPVRLSGPATQPISLRVATSRLSDGIPGPAWVDTLTISPGETVGYPTSLSDRVGGSQGTFWNPYQSTDEEKEVAPYRVTLSINTPGVSLIGPGEFYLYFYEPEGGFISRRCALNLIAFLMASASRDAGLKLSAQDTDPLHMDLLRSVRDQVMATTPQGRYYTNLYRSHSLELGQISAQHMWLTWRVVTVLQDWAPAFQGLLDGAGDQHLITPAMVNDLSEILQAYHDNASPALKNTIETEMAALDLPSFAGLTMDEALAKVNARSVSEVYLPFISRP